MLCICPRTGYLQPIPIDECPTNIGQIQKIAFQRQRNDTGSKNGFNSLAELNSLPLWIEKMTAVDSTKIVLTPFINNPENDLGGARQTSGGNADLGGIPEFLGLEASSFSCEARKVSPETGKALKQFSCETVGVYLFTENGKTVLDTETIDGEIFFKPIYIRGYYSTDRHLGGFDNPDHYAIHWSFPPNWSDNIVIIDVEFNPLFDLHVTTVTPGMLAAMKAKAEEVKIELISNDGFKKEFSEEHAAKLLRTTNSGWSLEKDSIYTFDYATGFDKSGSKGSDKPQSTGTKGVDSKGTTASGLD